jgi:hypothetical protein
MPNQIYDYLVDKDLQIQMSDLDKFIELYRSFGIECKVNLEYGNKIIYLCESTYSFDEQSTISDNLVGYPDFFSKVIFDGDGKFIEQGFYE